ncbi:hypothetical protein O3597_25755 [Verrucosispora sp. WMMA2044]|uniref:hypothetical protein n=1 Tax=Verrucosispora sp. WMMA2044 TaxID=3016419 RepID=UPI00248D387F|nr:hypothetical protein [Verrucosispora sp. WMMA2044]WBB48447.1 hypothetical protein O3597_25755 [Verrucosispora sp. WMMA2044]
MTATPAATGRSNGTTWHPAASPSRFPAEHSPTRPNQPVGEQTDMQLNQAVHRAAKMRTLFYVVVLLVALAGQVTAATQKLDIHPLIAIPAVGALELGGIVVMTNADVRRRLGERAIASRILSAAIAASAVAFNWLAHDNHLLGGFFAGMSALGYLVWLMHVENGRRDRLRATGAIPATTPAYELLGHWLRHPLITHRARNMAKADPRLGLYGSLHAAREELRLARRDAAVAKVLHRKIRSAVDPATAAIAVHVYNLDEIAARLADIADYDGLTTLIAADLTPARIACRAERREQERRDRKRPQPRRTTAGRQTPPARDELPGGLSVGSSRTPDETRGAESLTEVDANGDAYEVRTPPTSGAGHASKDSRAAVSTRAEAGLDGSTAAGSGLPYADESNVDDAARDSGPRNHARLAAVPGATAAAVAYWLNLDPQLGYDEIARRVGRTERTVRRNLPPGFRRQRVHRQP